MKRITTKSGFSAIAAVVIIAVVAAFIGLLAWSLANKKANEVDYDNYDLNAIIEGTEDNGNISDHIKGDKDAPVLIFEYADYQCPGCASANPKINKLVEEYDGKVAVVYRNFLLSYHQNGTAAASAAEAAGLQGYWKEYADKLFTNQSSWEYASADERGDIFVDYFEAVTDGEGDVEKFKEDMGSSAVSKKISFDMEAGNKMDVPGTPAFYIDGEWIDLTEVSTEDDFYDIFREKIDAKLKAKKE